MGPRLRRRSRGDWYVGQPGPESPPEVTSGASIGADGGPEILSGGAPALQALNNFISDKITCLDRQG